MTTYIEGDGRNTNTNIAKKVLNFPVPPKIQNCISRMACKKRKNMLKEKKEEKKKCFFVFGVFVFDFLFFQVELI